ncbi:MAG: exopolysaccharide biosynthesis polyprenyl glycosylphosphotransferase [Clostridia bacterium]|nr:exopolysaccharide biosynthesis polyprenyl glycosylphosphotransferase [Clostridia bacterium]
MNGKKYIKEQTILYLFKIMITAVFSIVMYGVWIEFYNDKAPTPFYRLGNYLLLVLFAVIYVAFVKVYGGFMVGTATVIDLIYSQVIAIMFLQGVSYIIFSLISYRLLSPWPFLGLFAAFSLFAALWVVVIDAIYFKLHAPKRTVVVFQNVDAYVSLKGIRTMDKRFKVVRTVNADKTDLERLFRIIDKLDAVFLCGVPAEYRNEVVKYCIANSKVAYIKPKISDSIIRGGRTIQLMDVPVYRCKRSNTSLLYKFLKRGFDILLSAIAIVISSPIMLLTALAIKLDDHGPVFYKQTRLTLNGKQFKIIKFRSMRCDAEKDGVARLAAEDDDRITRVGKIIRACRIDELPQVFNIFLGDMSMVGPRPERPEIAKEYEQEMPEFALRLQVKAGLTGYAQVYGKYNTTPYDKLQMDLIYVANQSLIEDLRLMLMTFKILFVPSSTQGVDADQRTAARKK